MSQKRTLLIVLVMGLLSLMALPAFAQDATQPSGTIRVSGMGSVNTPSDVATIILGVNVVDTDLKAAFSQANEQVAAIIAAVQDAGVDVKDIRTFGLNIYQDTGYMPMPMDGQTSEPVTPRYNVSNQVSVKVRDVSKVADVINAAVDAGANNLFGLEFGVAEKGTLQSEARALAIADARAKAQELATLAGVELGDIVMISEYTMGGIPFPANQRMDMGGTGAVIQPGQQEIGVQLDVTFAIKR